MAASFTNFCCRSGGSNLNAGTRTGNTTEPGTSADLTYASGTWVSATGVFTVASGNPVNDGVAVGDYASVYADGASVTTLVGRVTARTSTTITVSTTAKSGTTTDGTNTRTLKIGGAWLGPNAASGFPINLLTNAPTNAAGDAVRINLKNDASYSITAAINRGNASSAPHLCGYTSSYGDGGRAIIDGGTSGAAFSLVTNGTSSAGPWRIQDVEFKNNGASSTAALVSSTTINAVSVFVRCVFRDSRGMGLSGGSGGVVCVECEFYGCNQSNTSNTGGASVTGIGQFVRCIFHDNSGSNSFGLRCSSTHVSVANCVFDTNGSHGILASGDGVTVTACDFYNNGGSGISNTAEGLVVSTSNFIKNTAFGVATTGTNGALVTLYNCGFGAGTQANGSGTVGSAGANEIGSVSYASDVTPWTDPANGDFMISLAAAKGAGRGAFLQTAASYSGTVGYPDIGAAQHQETVTPASGGAFFTMGRCGL